MRWNPAISNFKRDDYDALRAGVFPYLSWSVWEYQQVAIGDMFYTLSAATRGCERLRPTTVVIPLPCKPATNYTAVEISPTLQEKVVTREYTHNGIVKISPAWRRAVEEMKNLTGILVATMTLANNLDRPFNIGFLFKVRFGERCPPPLGGSEAIP